jgi:DnaK suppressor protein
MMAGGGMFVSILKLMGFPAVEPVHSRAGETLQDPLPKAGRGALGAEEHKRDNPARRDHVNAKSGKDSKSKDLKEKAEKAAKKAAKTEKVSAKPAKSVDKAIPKSPSVAKTPVKPAPQPSKPVAKSAVKAMPKTATPPTATSAAKPAAKAATKAVAKTPSKTVAKAPAKAAAPVAVAKSAASGKSAAKSASTEKVSAPMTIAATKPATVSAPVAATAVIAQKTGRPSSRLAQLTVPSMAQAVASTAAKASYSQSAPSPVIVPVLPSSIKKDPKLANNWKTKPLAELTDADLMAMPDAEYMNDVQMAAFRLKLSTLKQEILNSAGETTEHLREDTSVVPDPADRATIEEEHALELRTRDRERKLLKKIEQSIGRIDAGDYGYCDETGEPIGVGRLLARPTATLSLEAQQRRELKQKMFGD